MPATSREVVSHRPVLAGLSQIDPVAFSACSAPFDDPEWLFEPKYDGFRGLIYWTKGTCRIHSRRNVRSSRFGELAERIAAVLGCEDAIVDGEIVALDRWGRPVFQDLLKGRGLLAFAAFDLLWLDGRDLRPLPLAERKRLLEGLLPADTAPIFKVFVLEEHGRALFASARTLDLEGIVAKRLADPYAPDTVWFEVKNRGHRGSTARSDVFRRRPAAPGATRERTR